jgi:hypothetical protein
VALFDVDDLASYLKTTLDADAADIAQRIATSTIEAYLGTDPDAPGSQTVYLPIDSRGRVRLPLLFDELTAVTDVDDEAMTYTYREGSGLITLDSPASGYRYDSYGYLSAEVKVTYTYSTVPAAVRDAALIIAASVYGPAAASGGSALGIQSETIGSYSVRYADTTATGASLVDRIPVEARLLLAPYRVPVVA